MPSEEPKTIYVVKESGRGTHRDSGGEAKFSALRYALMDAKQSSRKRPHMKYEIYKRVTQGGERVDTLVQTFEPSEMRSTGMGKWA